MKSTGRLSVSTCKSPFAVYINDVSPGPADCKRTEAQTPKNYERPSWKSIATKPCIHILLEHDDICSCMLHRGFTIAGTQTGSFRSSGLSVTYVSQ
ncbi:hypothetical protein F2Q70_00022320 [Brassica cretica]|uniref:Uncharacterized protein n=1 Tax=Brassica cretica TaxID=69181 RepID=A0A8S9GKV3_BRACR|nr:hypothetical protein F2Q70_00022320 [Brassica cretica]